MLQYAHTYGGPALCMTAVFLSVLPLLYFCLLRRRLQRMSLRLLALLAVWLAAFGIAYGDVFWIAWHAQRLCTGEAGMRVYGTVEAAGFLGVSSIETWAPYGFEFVEVEFIGGRKVRHVMRDGKPSWEEVGALLSRYEFRVESEPLQIPLTRNRYSIRDRTNGVVLGEIVFFNIYPGWLDRALLELVGFSWTPPTCWNKPAAGSQAARYQYADLIKAVIKPKAAHKGEMQ